MKNKKYHLAQVNIAQAKAEMDSDIMQGFVSRLDEINAIADKASGFIWRLQSDEGGSTSIRVFDDPLLLVNMSVWEDIDSLKERLIKSNYFKLVKTAVIFHEDRRNRMTITSHFVKNSDSFFCA